MGIIVQPDCRYCNEMREQIPFLRSVQEFIWNADRRRVCLVFHGRYEITPIQIFSADVEGTTGELFRIFETPWSGMRALVGSTPVTQRLITGTNLGSLNVKNGVFRVGERLVFTNITNGRGLPELPIAHILIG